MQFRGLGSPIPHPDGAIGAGGDAQVWPVVSKINPRDWTDMACQLVLVLQLRRCHDLSTVVDAKGRHGFPS